MSKKIDIRDRLDGVTLDEAMLVLKDLRIHYAGNSRIDISTDSDPYCSGDMYATVELIVKDD